MNEEKGYYIIEEHKNYYKVDKETGEREQIFYI
jgi:hypothetical protein